MKKIIACVIGFFLLLSVNVYAENKSVPMTDEAFYIMVTCAANRGQECAYKGIIKILNKTMNKNELKSYVQSCISEEFKRLNWKYIK